MYQNAVEMPQGRPTVGLAELWDGRGQRVAWGFYCPDSPIIFRVLSTEPHRPDENFFKNRVQRAQQIRRFLFDSPTNSYRLINGEGDGLPGLVCDIYDSVAVIQYDGAEPKAFWQQMGLKDIVQQWDFVSTVVEKPRGGAPLVPIKGSWSGSVQKIQENSSQFYVDIAEGQKTGFFMDQRDNRHYLSQWTKGLSVLNCFSYTGGFSVAAGLGGAEHVTSFDLSQKALDLAQKNWALNDLDETKHSLLKGDIYEMLARLRNKWDVIVVDPPSMAKSEKQKPGAIQKYTQIFKEALGRLESGGHLFLSSCSSHITFEDFYGIATEAFSKARRTGTLLKISGQGADHPFPLACPELRYLKFMHFKSN